MQITMKLCKQKMIKKRKNDFVWRWDWFLHSIKVDLVDAKKKQQTANARSIELNNEPIGGSNWLKQNVD